MKTLAQLLRPLAATATLTLAAACGGDETQAVEDHDPATFAILKDSAEVANAALTLTQGETVTIQFKFFNAAGEDLDDIEGSHFAGLVFTPTTLATATRVTGHNYRFEVTGGAPAAGSAVVSFGHDAEADEVSFPAMAITVEPAGPPASARTP
jgi:hypothetical protein